MQIVIDIDDNLYTRLFDNFDIDVPDMLNACAAIRKGTSLPKGHGRLIDADALEKKMCDREEELGDDRAMWESSAVSVALDMFGETIIEADKSESEDELDFIQPKKTVGTLISVDVLDKIRAEINRLTVYYTTDDKGINLISQNAVNRIFDKYKAESEEV